MADLESDVKAFEQLLPGLLSDQGKYALIINEHLEGVYAAYEDALKAGYEKALLDRFLVKKILTTENISYFSRDVPIECLTAR